MARPRINICPTCENLMVHVSADHVGGLNGIIYLECGACGYSKSITESQAKYLGIEIKPMVTK